MLLVESNQLTQRPDLRVIKKFKITFKLILEILFCFVGLAISAQEMSVNGERTKDLEQHVIAVESQDIRRTQRNIAFENWRVLLDYLVRVSNLIVLDDLVCQQF